MSVSASTGDFDNYTKLLEHLRNVLVVRPKSGELNGARKQAEQAALSAPRIEDRARFCHILAQHFVNHGEINPALHWINEAVRLSSGHPRMEALTAYYHASILHRAGRSSEALEIIEPLSNLSPEEDLSLASRITTVRAGIFDSLGRIEDAENSFQEALALREKVGDSSGLAVVYYNYAEFCKRRDRIDSALEYFLKAYNIDVTLDNPAGIAQSACQIGLICARQNDREEAERWFGVAASSADESETPIIIAFVKVNRATLYDFLNDHVMFQKQLAMAFDYVRNNKFESYFPNIQGEIGSVFITDGRYAEAEPLLEYALKAAQQEDKQYHIGYNLFQFGRLRNGQGRYEEAREVLEKAVSVLKTVNNHKYTGKALRELALTYAELGETSLAFRQLSKWMDEFLAEYEEETKRRWSGAKLHVEPRSPSELSEVYRQKNAELSDALAKLEQANKELRDLATDKDEFMAIAAHDLRNPLSDMRSMLQTVISHYDVLVKGDILDICRDLLTVTTRMSATIHAFLEISRTDKRSVGITIGRVDLVHIIHLALERHHTRAEEKGMTLTIASTGQAWASADASVVSAVLDNLISNAIKYSPHDTQITVFAGTDDRSAFITVCDEGPGIPEADRDKLFTKYSRMSIRPTGGEDSLGIGLYLAKRMAERMNAQIEYKYQNGSCFTLRMNIG
ncbi:MAG: tetratricopeptide repeat protein [Ignavibacteria bacterium]|nr:tetratricopeptide repeat protein [Ignavibacteria bacterium]